MSITREELAAQSPELLQQIQSEASAAGATAERERILGVEAHAMAGHEKLIATLKADGKTTPDQAAAQVLVAHRSALSAQAAALVIDAPAALPAKVDNGDAGGKKAPTQQEIGARATELMQAAMASGKHMSYATAATKAFNELSAQA